MFAPCTLLIENVGKKKKKVFLFLRLIPLFPSVSPAPVAARLCLPGFSTRFAPWPGYARPASCPSLLPLN